MAGYFSDATFDFLEELAGNNNRDWFNTHRSEYEGFVREPSLAFIHAMQPELARFAPRFVADDRRQGGSLMRIYRDMRFSRNRQPYKTNIGIQFRHEQGRDVHAPGFYLHIETQEVFVGAGIWHPDGTTLNRVRIHSERHPKRWQQAVRGKRFREFFHMAGDSLKRPPKGFAADHPLVDELKRKDFIAIAPLLPDLILEDDLPSLIGSYFERTIPLMKELCQAIDLPF